MDLFYGAWLFLGLFGLHLLLWRSLRFQAEIIPLFSLFLVLPGMGFLLALVWVEPWFLASMALLYYALAAAYIQTYPAITTEIPSFRILLMVQEGQASTKAEILKEFSQGELLGSRSQLLESDGLVQMTPEGPRLTLAGQVIAGFFLAFRSFLGLERGKG